MVEELSRSCRATIRNLDFILWVTGFYVGGAGRVA